METSVVLSPASLANTVTAFAAILSGILCITLTFLTRPQPYRWLFAYLCLVLTGGPTIWFHGFGESVPASIADIASNYLFAWSLQYAVLGDYYRRRHRYAIAGASALVNLASIVYKILAGPQRSKVLAIPLGGETGFTVTEVVLILDALLVLALLFAKVGKMYEGSRPLLYLTMVVFVVGLVLAGPADSIVGFGIIPYHAAWHIVGSFGVMTLWFFNFVRFTAMRI